MQHSIELDNQDTDIDVVLPGGQLIQFQFRTLSPSIDVCLPVECGVTNWQGDDMEAAQAVGKEGHVRLAKQLVIDLNPAWLVKEEQ